METFLTAMNAGDTPTARSALDLTAIEPILQITEGDRLCSSLWDIINRTRYVQLSEIPSDADGEAYVFHRYGPNNLTIEIAKSGDGAWRFSSPTVSQIDALYLFVREQEWDVVKDPSGNKLETVGLIQANPSMWLKQRVPENWHKKVLGIEAYNYVAVLALFVVAFFAGLLIRLFTRIIVRSSFHIDEEIADKRQLKSIGRSISLIVNAAMMGAGMPFLELPFFITNFILFLLKALSAFGWLWLVSMVWDVFVGLVARRASLKSKSANNVVVPMASKFGRAVIFVGVLIFFVAQLGYDVRALLTGLGIGGLVFALAAKDSVENLFGSITILMEMPFGVGDWVRIGDIDGNVEEINLRSTRIRTFEDSLITLPNSRLITSHVENFGARRRRRLKTSLGIAYSTPPEKIEMFCERIRQMLLDHPGVWSEKRLVYFNDLTDSTLNVLLYCYIEAETWTKELEIRDDVLNRVMRIATEMNVEFAFPTRTVLMQTSQTT